MEEKWPVYLNGNHPLSCLWFNIVRIESHYRTGDVYDTAMGAHSFVHFFLVLQSSRPHLLELHISSLTHSASLLDD